MDLLLLFHQVFGNYLYYPQCTQERLFFLLFFYDSINNFCKENNLKYMPFVGRVSERPSILEGDIDDMIQEANIYICELMI